MKKIVYCFLPVFMLIVGSSCEPSCNCTKNLGCVILTATSSVNAQVRERKVYCSQENYSLENWHADSLRAFSGRHQQDSTVSALKDSIYYTQRMDRLNAKETQDYENKGYLCSCAK